MAICCVSEKIQTAYLRNTLRAMDFFASLHLTILERPANFEFFKSVRKGEGLSRELIPLPARQHEVQGGVSSTRGCDLAYEWRIELRGL